MDEQQTPVGEGQKVGAVIVFRRRPFGFIDYRDATPVDWQLSHFPAGVEDDLGHFRLCLRIQILGDKPMVIRLDREIVELDEASPAEVDATRAAVEAMSYLNKALGFVSATLSEEALVQEARLLVTAARLLCEGRSFEIASASPTQNWHRLVVSDEEIQALLKEP